MARSKTPSRPEKSFTPSYRRQSRPSGQDDAFVQIDGRRTYLGPYDAPETREKYHRLIAEWEAGGRTEPVAPEEITVAEVGAQYLDWARTYYVKNGHVTAEPSNIALAIRNLRKLYGHSPAASFGPKALKIVRQTMVENGWSRKYTNKHVDRIKRMFKWAVAEELIPPGVYEGLRALAGLRYGRCGATDHPPVQPADLSLVEATKPHVSRQVAAMIDLQLLTGARPGEITILRPCDIDRSQKVWVYRPAEHKTEHHGHERRIFIGPKAQDILAPFLLRAPEAYCFSPNEAEQERRAAQVDQCPHGGKRVGMNRKARPRRTAGLHYTRNSYRRAIDRGIEQAFPLPAHLGQRELQDGKIESQRKWLARQTAEEKAEIRAWFRRHHWHPHQLRHNYATYVRKEFGLEAAQVLLGHSKADVTQVYAERDVSRAFSVAAKIG